MGKKPKLKPDKEIIAKLFPRRIVRELNSILRQVRAAKASR